MYYYVCNKMSSLFSFFQRQIHKSLAYFLLLSTVFAFFSRFLCHTTCNDVPITKHDIFQWFDRETSDNYFLKIANGQLGDLFCFCFLCVFYRKSYSFSPSFPSIFPFLLSFISPTPLPPQSPHSQSYLLVGNAIR